MDSPAVIMSPSNLNLRLVLSETKRIIKANGGHFLALSLFFVLPLSFTVIVYPSFSQSTSITSIYNRFLSSFSTPVSEGESPPFDKSDVIFTVLRTLFVLLFSLFTTASITHSTWNAFFGKPLGLTSSLKSILVSFLPLTATYVVSRLILVLILFAFGGLSALVFGGVVLYGTETDYGNVYFLVVSILITILLVGVIIYIEVEWYLAYVVVVIESKWGFEPLGRSSYLVKGMKWIAFSILMYFAVFTGLMSALYSSSIPSFIKNGSFTWDFLLLTALFTVFATALMLYSVAAAAVLFIYCQALHGELTSDIVDVFTPLYVGWPSDGDEKDPKVVYVV